MEFTLFFKFLPELTFSSKLHWVFSLVFTKPKNHFLQCILYFEDYLNNESQLYIYIYTIKVSPCFTEANERVNER